MQGCAHESPSSAAATHSDCQRADVKYCRILLSRPLDFAYSQMSLRRSRHGLVEIPTLADCRIRAYQPNKTRRTWSRWALCSIRLNSGLTRVWICSVVRRGQHVRQTTAGESREFASADRDHAGDTEVKGTLGRAQTLHLEGRLTEAEAHYRDVLQDQPDAVEAIRGLGALAYQHGRVDEAVALFARGVAIRPIAADFHANLAESLRIAKRPDEALERVHKALVIDPSLVDGWNTLGLLEHAQGRYQDAEIAFREAIRLRPNYIAAHINLGNTLSKQGRFDHAAIALRTALQLEPENAAALTSLGQLVIESAEMRLLDEAESLLRRALVVAPGLAPAINSLGNVLRLRGDFESALSCYLRALQLDPRGAMPCHNIGKLLQDQGRFDDAAAWFERAQVVQNDPARYHANLGSLWAAREQYDESARCYRLALAHDRDLAEAHHGLGESLLELGLLDEADACFREAIRIDAALPLPWLALANLFATRGDFEQSCQAARESLARRPNLSGAYVRLACNLKGQLPLTDIQAMENMLHLNYLTDETRSLLNFALAGVFDAQGKYAAAATRLEHANRLQSSGWAARGQLERPDDYSRFIERIIATFTPQLFARGRSWGDPDERPVFVVGLPRSGTTLIEQILASHPEVHGAGELPDVRRVFQSLPALVGLPAAGPFDALAALGPISSRTAARQYLDRLNAVAPSSAVRVVDKMPGNIDLLGLIALLWPSARVIVCHRDLRDVAVSCWQTGFASIRWANDHEHIARRFADQKRVLDHWRQIRPLEWLNVTYEELVSDLQGHARRLIDFLGLEWDPVCLHFHSTPSVVKSASQVQVRQPIHSKSVGRWKNYESMLQPLFQAIKRLGIDSSI
jgi:tetratricopeptide (TPR) repeat protein